MRGTVLIVVVKIYLFHLAFALNVASISVKNA